METMVPPRDESEKDLRLGELTEAFFLRRRQGEALTVEAFIAEHPEEADGLRELLPSLALLDRDAEETATEARLPERIGRYRLRREIGRGGMGLVFEAIQEPLGRRVALKVMTAVRWADPRQIERFRREAEIAARLRHPGICTVYEAGIEEGVSFISMELVDGEPLGRHLLQLRDPPRARLDHVLDLVAQAARALQHAHEAGVIHRDVKPSNLMVTPEGRVVVLDFGLARDDASEDDSLTRPGDVFGTLSYMAPEQMSRDAGPLDGRCDVFSLGVTLFECLGARRPFEGATRAALGRSILEDPIPDLRRLEPAVSRPLATVVETALSRDREHRYRSARAFADDLDRVRRREPILARRARPWNRIAMWARRRPAIAALTLGLVITLGAAAGLGVNLLANLPKIRQQEERARQERIEADLERGYLHLVESRWREAAPRFLSLLEEDPEILEARVGLVLALRRLGERDRARRVLANAPVRQRRSFALVSLARDDTASGASESPSGGEPSSALDHFVVGMQRIVFASDDRAREHAREAYDRLTAAVIASPRARPLYHFLRARAAFLAGDADMLAAAVQPLLELWPDSPRTWHLRALQLLGAPRTELIPTGRGYEATGEERQPPPSPQVLAAARAAYERALELDPDAHASRINLASLLDQSGESERAVAELRHVLDRDPGQATAWLNLGLIEASRGDRAAAEAAFLSGLEHRPQHPRLWRQLGNLRLAGGGHTAAREAFQRAVAISSRDVEGYIGVAATWLAEGRLEPALDACRDATRADPKSAKAWLNLAHVLHRLNRAEAALGASEKACALDPMNPMARNNAAVLLERSDRHREALEHHRAGLSLSGADRAAFLAGIGRCLVRLGELEAAVAPLEECREILDGSPGKRPRLEAAVERYLRLARRP